MKRIGILFVLLISAHTLSAQDITLWGNVLLDNSSSVRERFTEIPAPTPEQSLSREQEFFRRMHWTQDEIDWFYTVYIPMYGGAQAYIDDQLAMLDILEGTTTPDVTPTPDSTVEP